MGKTEKKEMISRLSYFEKQGVKMYLDGKLSSSEKIADACCVKEKGIYIISAYDNEGSVSFPAAFKSTIGVYWSKNVRNISIFRLILRMV